MQSRTLAGEQDQDMRVEARSRRGRSIHGVYELSKNCCSISQARRSQRWKLPHRDLSPNATKSVQ